MYTLTGRYMRWCAAVETGLWGHVYRKSESHAIKISTSAMDLDILRDVVRCIHMCRYYGMLVSDGCGRREGIIRQVRHLESAGGDPEIWYTRGTLRFASVTDQIRPHMI